MCFSFSHFVHFIVIHHIVPLISQTFPIQLIARENDGQTVLFSKTLLKNLSER